MSQLLPGSHRPSSSFACFHAAFRATAASWLPPRSGCAGPISSRYRARTTSTVRGVLSSNPRTVLHPGARGGGGRGGGGRDAPYRAAPWRILSSSSMSWSPVAPAAVNGPAPRDPRGDPAVPNGPPAAALNGPDPDTEDVHGDPPVPPGVHPGGRSPVRGWDGGGPKDSRLQVRPFRWTSGGVRWSRKKICAASTWRTDPSGIEISRSTASPCAIDSFRRGLTGGARGRTPRRRPARRRPCCTPSRAGP